MITGLGGIAGLEETTGFAGGAALGVKAGFAGAVGLVTAWTSDADLATTTTGFLPVTAGLMGGDWVVRGLDAAAATLRPAAAGATFLAGLSADLLVSFTGFAGGLADFAPLTDRAAATGFFALCDFFGFGTIAGLLTADDLAITFGADFAAAFLPGFDGFALGDGVGFGALRAFAGAAFLTGLFTGAGFIRDGFFADDLATGTASSFRSPGLIPPADARSAETKWTEQC